MTSSPLAQRAGRSLAPPAATTPAPSGRATRWPGRWLPLIAACGAVAALAACAANDPPKPPPPRPPIEAAGRAAIRVDDADSGAAIVLERGQELVVTLQVEGTRGADWSLVGPTPAIVEIAAGPRFERALRTTVIDEADGATVWHFRPLAAGSATLAFEQRRPQARGPAVRSVSFALTVR